MTYTLTAFGPPRQLHEFMAAAQGPGFIDWNPNWVQRAQDWTYQMLASGMAALLPAEIVAKSLRERFWKQHEAMRSAAEQDPTRQVLDLNALIPVPDDVRRSGYWPSGRSWCLDHWGVAFPLGIVKFEMRTQRLPRSRVRQLATFRFEAESPIWPVVRHVMACWPALTVNITDQDSANDAAIETRQRNVERRGRAKPRLPVQGNARPRKRRIPPHETDLPWQDGPLHISENDVTAEIMAMTAQSDMLSELVEP